MYVILRTPRRGLEIFSLLAGQMEESSGACWRAGRPRNTPVQQSHEYAPLLSIYAGKALPLSSSSKATERAYDLEMLVMCRQSLGAAVLERPMPTRRGRMGNLTLGAHPSVISIVSRVVVAWIVLSFSGFDV